VTATEPIIADVARRFVAQEFPDGKPRVDPAPLIIAVGTIAEKAVNSPLLRQRLEAAHVRSAGLRAFTELAVLRSSPFSLALILSPFKREVARSCDRLAPCAVATKVVDTVVKTKDATIGINTNCYAAAAALEHLLGTARPSRVLIAGTGASARSVAIAVARSFPHATVGIVGRSRDGAAALVRDVGVGIVTTDSAGFSADAVINATTVGETDDAGVLGFDLESCFGPGVRYFDLNNRTSTLQQAALGRGCLTMSGVLMQIVTNALRVSLVTP
jgi:shikimate dehydrogenase